MPSPTKKPVILVNVGKKNRADFKSETGDVPVISLKSKHLLLHITESMPPSFILNNAPIDLRGAYVFIRLRGTDTHFCGMMVEYLNHHKIPTNDPVHASYPHTAEKITQMLLLSLRGIRVPETLICREESFETNYDYIASHVTFPCVYKTAGRQGKNVHLVHTMTEVRALLKEKKPHHLFLLQSLIENTFDTRTLLFKETILGCISRTRTNGFHNNIALGAVPARFSLSPLEERVAIDAARVCRIDFAGVDMIHTTEGPVVLEVNKSPQVRGFESVYEGKVFTRLASLILREYGIDA